LYKGMTRGFYGQIKGNWCVRLIGNNGEFIDDSGKIHLETTKKEKRTILMIYIEIIRLLMPCNNPEYFS
jgi:hypothetical protein